MLRLAALSLVLALALGLACDTGSAGPASVRIGHFIPDVPGPQAIDVCLKPDGTSTYSGKLVQNGGLNFASVSARTSLDAGTYSLRIVAANAADCSASLGGVGDIGGIGVGGDTAVTLALVGLFSGSGSSSVAEKTLVDDTGAPAAPGVKLRYVHLSPELGQVDMGVLSGTSFFPLNPAVSLGYAASSQYFTYQGVNDTLAIVDSGTANLRLSGGVTATGGTSNSVFIVGRPGQTSGDPRLSFLLCNENGAPSCTRSP